MLPNGHFDLSPRLERRIEEGVIDSVANGIWNLFTAVKQMLTAFCGIFIGVVHATVDALNDHFIWFCKTNKKVRKHAKQKYPHPYRQR